MVPERAQLVVVPQSFGRSGVSAVTGPIWLRHRAPGKAPVDFPRTGWTDFPIRVLAAWLAGLALLASGDANESMCHFEDGPFTFTVADAGETLLRVRCIEDDSDGTQRVVDDFATPGKALYESVRAGAVAALAECDRRGWVGRDVDELRSTLGSRDGARGI